MSFENTDKKTAQEVSLLFKGSALILLYIQVRLGRYQPPGLPTGLEPGLTKPQYTWNAPQSVPEKGEGQMRGLRGPHSHSILHYPPPLKEPHPL